eukprot:3451127-Rhodomonas_salina.2
MTRKRTKKTEMGIPRARIERLVRELVAEHGAYKVQADVVEILRGASEALLVDLFQQANVVRSASRREKMHVSHLQCARGIMQQAQGV